MDFHALPRRDLQVLAKRNGVRANMTNGAMADALAALPAVDGIAEYVQQAVVESTPAAEPVVQASEEEEEKEEVPSEEEQEKQVSLPGGQGVALTPHEVIVLDDSEEEENNLSPGENEEKALGAGRRRATRRGRVEPVAAPATRKRAASSKADKADAAVEAVPARATRARSQRTVVSVAEEEAPNTRRTSRRAVTSKTGTEQEEGEKKTQGDVSDVEADVPALISSDDGEMEVATDVQNEEQNEPAEEQSQEDEVEAEKGDAAADVVPPRATRARRQRTVLSVAHEEEQGQEDEVEAEKGDAAADALPARSTRGRSKRAVLPVAEEEAPKTRRTSRRAAASKTCMQQEVEEKGPQRDVSDVEAAVPAPASSDEGSDGAEVAQKEEQKQSQEDDGETQKVAAEAVPARATRARRQRTAESVAEEEAPKTRRTSRRAVASKTGTQQEEEEKRTHGGVSDMETDVPALVSSDEGGDGAEEMEVAIDAQNEGEAQKGDAAADAVPARVTRARRQRAVVSAEEEEAPKTRQTSRRAAASKTCMQQEVEEKGAQRDVSDVEAPVPAPATSDEGGDGAEAMEVAKDAQNEEQNGPDEEQSQVDEGKTEKEDVAVEAVPAGATRTRRQRAAVSAAEEEAPKTRRTSRRATARKTSTDQEQGEKATQGDVSDMEAAVDAPVSSTEGDDGSQEMEAAVDAQNEEQFPAAEAVPARATRARSHRTVVSAAEDEAPKAKRTSRRAAARKTRTEQDEEEKATQGDVSHVKEAVRAPVSSDEEADGTEEMEVAIDAQNKEQNELVEDQTPEEEGVVAEEEPALEEDCMVDSSVEEQLVDVQQCEDSPVVLGLAEQERSDTFQNDAEDTEVVPIDSEEFEVPTSVEVLQIADKSIDEHEEMAADMVTNITDVSVEDMAGHASEENEDCTVEKELAVAEDVDSSVQEPLVDVQQCQPCEATEEIHHADDSEMVAEAMLESGDATEEVDCSSDVAEESEEESPVAEHVDSSSVQEPLVDVQQCEATEVPQAMLESGEATEEGDCSSDVAEESEEESPVAEHVDSSVPEPLVNVQQFEATEQIHLASEDTEMVPVLESGEAREEGYFTGDVGYASEEIEVPASDEVLQSPAKAVEEIEVPTSDEVLQSPAKAVEEIEVPTSDEVIQSPAKAVEENEDTAADEVPHNTYEYVEEEAMVATDGMPQAMDQDVVEVVTVENLSQGTVTDIECAIKESGFTPDLTDVSREEEAAVTADEMPLSLAALDESVNEEVITVVEIMSQATVTCDVKESGLSYDDLADVSAEDKEVVAADGMPQSSATMEEDVEEVVTVDNLSQASVTDDEGAVKETSGFTGELMDVLVEEEGAVATDEIPHSSATMDEDVDSLSHTTLTEEECAVNESVFSCGLAVLSVDEEAVMAAESSATMNKDVEEVATIDNLSQTMVADGEWAVTESAFTGACTPVADTARDFSDQIASPFSANVFEYATKSLSMEPMVTEPVALHQENEVFKEGGNEPEAASVGRIMHSPLSIRKLRTAVAQENEADSVPPCTIRKLRTDLNEKVAVQAENEVKEEGNQSEAAFGGSMHSPLSIRKLRTAVAQVIEADSVPRCLTIRKLRTNLSEKVAVEPMVAEPADVPLCVYGSSSGNKNASEPVAVQLENEVKEGNQPEAAFGGIMHSPLSIRKLRTAVAQEIDADSVPPCTIRKLRTNLNEKVAAVQGENEVKEGNQPEASFGTIMHSPLSIMKLRTAVAQEIEADSVPWCLTIRKIRTNPNEKVAVAQENEVKEGEKSSVPLDKLSLRKLRMKLRETLNAHKNVEPKRVPLGRLDENAC